MMEISGLTADELAARDALDEQSLAKANEAIAIRPKRGKLTLLSRRIYNAMLYHAQKQGVEKPVYSLGLNELIGDARFNSKNTELLKSHLRDMQATVIEWSTSAAGQRKWISTQLIGTVTIDEPGRGRACNISWSYPDEIRDRLVRPNQYTRVLLEISSRMRSYPAAVLYELGERYLSSPIRLTMREDTIWWAAVLTGRSDITDVDYRFLKRDVISKALVEVDTLCDEFSLELIEHKRGRKVEELQFRVVSKATRMDGPTGEPARKAFDLKLIERLVAIGLKLEDAQDLYAATDEALIRQTIDHVEQRLRSHLLPDLKSPAAYFRDAIKKGYVSAAAGVAAPVPASAPPVTKAPPELTPTEKLQRVKERWETEQVLRAQTLYNELPDAAQQGVRARFEAEYVPHLPPPIASAWARDGAASRLASSSFYRWFAQVTWPAPATDSALLDFALSHGLMKG